MTTLCAATGVPLHHAGGAWQLDPDRLAAAMQPRTRLVLMNFPNSPTGAVLDAAGFAAVVALCRRHGAWLLSDEVYRGTELQPAGGPPAAAEAYERGISVNGLSKGFGMPGLRVGWAACRDGAVLAAALHAKGGMSGCLAAPSEVLARIALRAEPRIMARSRSIGLANLDRMQALLRRCSSVLEADRTGSFAFASVRCRDGDADGFAAALARDAGILVMPSGLWRSPLAPLPADRLRISLGRQAAGPGLDALDRHLRAPHPAAVPAGTG